MIESQYLKQYFRMYNLYFSFYLQSQIVKSNIAYGCHIYKKKKKTGYYFLLLLCIECIDFFYYNVIIIIIC